MKNDKNAKIVNALGIKIKGIFSYIRKQAQKTLILQNFYFFFLNLQKINRICNFRSISVHIIGMTFTHIAQKIQNCENIQCGLFFQSPQLQKDVRSQLYQVRFVHNYIKLDKKKSKQSQKFLVFSFCSFLISEPIFSHKYQLFSPQKQIVFKIKPININIISNFLTDIMSNYIAKDLYDQFCGQNRSIGSWSFNQNLLYVLFLQKNKLSMVSKKKRRNQRVFDRMAELIPSRNSLQCRSHHQKLLQKFGEVKFIISNFKKYISKEDYKIKFHEIYGDVKSKQQGPVQADQVKKQELSQQAEQLMIKLQDNAPAVIEHPVRQIDKSYDQFFTQMRLQFSQYPLMNFYYTGLQMFP